MFIKENSIYSIFFEKTWSILVLYDTRTAFHRYLPSGGTSRKIDFAHILLLEKALARNHTGFSFFFFFPNTASFPCEVLDSKATKIIHNFPNARSFVGIKFEAHFQLFVCLCLFLFFFNAVSRIAPSKFTFTCPFSCCSFTYSVFP